MVLSSPVPYLRRPPLWRRGRYLPRGKEERPREKEKEMKGRRKKQGMFNYNRMANLLHASAGNYAQINKSWQILHIEYFGTVWCNRSPAAPLQLGNSLKVRIQMKHCQKHNGPKALSTLTQSTSIVQNRSFNKL